MRKNDIFKDYLENKYPNDLHLLFSLPLGIIMLVIRYLFLRFIFQPVGQYLGLQGRLLIAQQNEMLENAFASGQMDYRTIAKLSKKIQWTKKEIKEWFKIRHSQKEVPDLGNFCESSWRCFYATCSFTYGIFFFWNMPWLWDIKECYYDHPFHEVTNNMWWYFLINMAYYWSRIIIHYYSTSTQNFTEFFFHNIVLLAFLHLSWYVNLVRLGIIIILGMVFGDMIAERMNLIHFTIYHVCWDFITIILVLIWILGRNYVFLIYIVYGSIAAGFEIIQITTPIAIMYCLLVIFVIMDGFWIRYYLSLSD